jgi:O-acetyl-ADP-ribose deacetylase (regulator of RNase III)
MLENITFHLCDINLEVVESWKSYFSDYDNFKFYHEDLIKVFDEISTESENKICGIVSPANSFGDMQGGIDLVFYTKFGWKLEELVMQSIIDYKFGELTVGNCITLLIPHSDALQECAHSESETRDNYLIVAPTMRVPMGIKGTTNVYLAFRAALISLITANNNITDVFVSGYTFVNSYFLRSSLIVKSKNLQKHISGMGTGIGKIDPNICGKQMFYAYHNILNPKSHNDLIQMTREHSDLLN